MKTRYTIYYMLIVLAALSAPISAEYNIAGDVNADGRITTADSLLALRMAAGSVATDPERADVNADGRVNSLDALMIRTIVQKTQVCVNAPEVVSGTFEVTINIYNAVNLDSGQFDLSFNSSVVNVTAVHDGNIDGRQVPVESWDFVDSGTIRVLFNLPGVTRVSGQGQIATISFEVTGSQGDSCVLDISDGLLVDTDASVIPAIWNDCEVAIIEAETPHVMVNAPEIVSGTFDVAIDIKNAIGLASGQFDLSFDPGVVNVTGVDTGKIDNTTIPIALWHFMDADTIRIFFELSDGNGVSGSGYVARVNFEVTGSQGDVSVLDISDGVLVDTGGEKMPAIWTPDHVTITVPVTVNAPEVVSGAFEVTIDIENVTDLDCGQFELSFDSSIVNVTGVSAGNISGTAVPMDMWVFGSAESIRVLFNLPGLAGVSGSGQIATISFETTGSEGYSVLGISDEMLVDNRANTIPSIWTDDMVISGEYTLVDRVHNLDTGEDFLFIQDAIDDPDTSDGHTIMVGDGIHRENVRVTKSLTILSENGSANCVIKARGNDHAVEITADYVNMSGFTVTGAAFLKAGICLDAGYCNISTNNCSNNWICIHLDGSSNNIVSDNDCSNTGWDGIRLEDSSNNIISGNDCSNNKMTGIHFRESSNNIISSNNCSNNNMTGIRFRESSNNIVSITDCSNNGYEGINLEDSNNNNISGNNCSNNGIETGGFGITLRGSSNNRISGNKVSFNRWNGIILRDSMTYSSNNNIVRNNISNNGQFWEPPLDSGCAAGISLTGSGNSIIENTFVNDGIHIYHDSTKNEVRGNIVNGKPLIYLESESDQEIEGAGQVILANCDNITVGHSDISNTIVGIHLMETNNCKITKNNISSNYMHGIRLDDSSNNTIGDNDINSNNQHGIYVFGSSDNNTIRENLIELNKVDGIHLFFSGHNEFINNTVNRNHEYGIYLWSLGSTNTLRGNRMSGNKYNFAVPHSSDDDVDTTNLVDGKPIYYIKNASDLTIDGTTNAGTVYCVNCENVTVKDLVLANNGAGVCFYKINNSRIENVTSIGCREGICLHKSQSNTLTNNCASNGQEGVCMERSDDNVLTNNDVLNNSRGIYLYRSNNSLIYFNNFVYNSLNVQSRNSTNIWSSPSMIHYTYDGSAHSNYPGNYWDDYSGTDADGDGIGKSPYNIDSDRDNYPLVTPSENYFVET